MKRAPCRSLRRLALAALLLAAVPTPAAALVGDRDQAFGVDGNLQMVIGATHNYDAPLLFGPNNSSDAFAEQVLRLVAGGNPSAWSRYEIHGLQRLNISTLAGAEAMAPLSGRAGNGADFRWVAGEHSFGEDAAGDVQAHLELDRLNIKFVGARHSVTIGRQAITFGTTYFWNPVDSFAPFSSLQFDREYKAGVDALRADFALGDFSGLTIVATAPPYGSPEPLRESVLLARSFGNFADWDVAAQLAATQGGWQAALTASGDLAGTELRGELLYTHTPPSAPLASYVTAVVGVGRQLSSETMLQFEHIYSNHRSRADDSLVTNLALLGQGRVLQASHNVSGAVATHQASALLSLSCALLFEWDARSALLQPGLRYSAADEVDLIAGALLPLGERPGGLLPKSEFGLYPSIFYGETKIYF